MMSSMTSSLVLIASLVLSVVSWNGVAAFTHQPSPRLASCHGSPSNTCMSMVVDSDNDDSSTSSKERFKGIRYLGQGNDAIIRPGVVLVAPKHEYDHFLRKSAVFVYAIGLGENDSMIIRGVVIDHPTAFTIGEMSPNVMGKISDNQLFRGGYDGSDSAMLLHSAGGLDGPVKTGDEIGSSGIYEGGIVSAIEAVEAGLTEPDRCKFFFNHMQFTDKELDDMFSGTEDGDKWVSLEIPPEYVLNSDYDRGDLWSRLRNGFIYDMKQGY